MGEVGRIFNCKGDDFTVYEGDATSDGYIVYVSNNWDGSWTELGTGSGTTNFDLEDIRVDSARFIKIKDDGSGSATEPNPGFDLDAIENLNPTDVFVDDDFNSSTPGWKFDHFDSIQDAIDVVGSPGNVIVYEGEYSADTPDIDIIIDKSIVLIGESEKKPVIDGLGNGNVLTVLSEGVRVSNFIIRNSGDDEFGSGIEINSDFNIISDIDITDNNIGLKISGSSNNNLIYHNNFMRNNQNAYDTGNPNQWDNDYSSGGNYWDDYIGTDSNEDGIGDTPYYVPGGSSEDKYPFMKPYGYPSNPPSTPVIKGSSEGKPGIMYKYTFVSTDEDNHDLFYTIDWGDGTIDKTDVFPSGTEVIAYHIWEEKDKYIIKAKAHDPYTYESDWGTLEVTIPRTKYLYNSLLTSLFQSYHRINLILKIILNFRI